MENEVVAVTAGHTSAELDDGAVVLNLRSGTYFGFNEAGRRIWALVQQPVSVSEIVETLRGEYDVPPDQCRHEVEAFLERLLAQGLIHVCR